MKMKPKFLNKKNNHCFICGTLMLLNEKFGTDCLLKCGDSYLDQT